MLIWVISWLDIGWRGRGLVYVFFVIGDVCWLGVVGIIVSDNGCWGKIWLY